MRVTIFASNLSSNAMGRVLVLARVLERRYDVEVIGPLYGERVWEPIDNEDLDIRSIRVDESPRAMGRLRRLTHMATGDVYLACKPLASSLGPALSARRRTGRPVIVDVDDWEWGLTREAIASARHRLRYLASSALHAHLPNAWPGALYYDRMVRRADAVIVSNSFLQERYGGTIVWHGRDTDAFDPARYPRGEMRARLGFGEDEKIVMFFGTIQPYKGTTDLIDAVGRLRRKDVRLVLVGVQKTAAARRAAAQARDCLGERVTTFGTQPFERVPEFMACADVVAVPQRHTAATVRQMPAKLFDAMAMARPIVATAVSDMPRVLDGCGWVVAPDSPGALADAISDALADPERAGELGDRARQRCIADHSWDAMDRTLAEVFLALERAR